MGGNQPGDTTSDVFKKDLSGFDDTSVLTKRDVLFATDATRTKSNFYLKGDPVSLIASNIESFMGGRGNPWGKADAKVLGVVDGSGDTLGFESGADIDFY